MFTFYSGTTVNYTTLYDLDFTAQTPQTLSSNTDYTIDGKTWTKVNSAADATAAAVDSTGLRFRPASASDYNSGAFTMTMPHVYALLSTLCPTLDFTKSVRVWVYVGAFNGASNYDNTAMGFASSSSLTGSVTWIVVKRGYGLPGQGIASVINSDGTNSDTNYHDTKLTIGSTNNVVVMEFHPDGDSLYTPNEFRVFYGSYSSGWPDVSTLKQCTPARHTGDFVSRFTTANTRLFLGGMRAASGTSLDTSIARIKIEVRV